MLVLLRVVTEYHIPLWIVEHLQYDIHVIKDIRPVNVGINMSLVRQLLIHPLLQDHLQCIKCTEEQICIEVQHKHHQVIKVLKNVSEIRYHS